MEPQFDGRPTPLIGLGPITLTCRSCGGDIGLHDWSNGPLICPVCREDGRVVYVATNRNQGQLFHPQLYPRLSTLPYPIRTDPYLIAVLMTVEAETYVASGRILEHSRRHDITLAHRLAWWLARSLTAYSLAEIGRWFGGVTAGTVRRWTRNWTVMEARYGFLPDDLEHLRQQALRYLQPGYYPNVP